MVGCCCDFSIAVGSVCVELVLWLSLLLVAVAVFVLAVQRGHPLHPGDVPVRSVILMY